MPPCTQIRPPCTLTATAASHHNELAFSHGLHHSCTGRSRWSYWLSPPPTCFNDIACSPLFWFQFPRTSAPDSLSAVFCHASSSRIIILSRCSFTMVKLAVSINSINNSEKKHHPHHHYHPHHHHTHHGTATKRSTATIMASAIKKKKNKKKKSRIMLVRRTTSASSLSHFTTLHRLPGGQDPGFETVSR